MLMSDICVKSHFFFTSDALLVCVRELSLTRLHDADGCVSDREVALYFADMTKAELRVTELDVTLSNTKKKVHVKQHELVIWGTEGEMLCLPVHNDVDMDTMCEDVNRRIKENTQRK